MCPSRAVILAPLFALGCAAQPPPASPPPHPAPVQPHAPTPAPTPADVDSRVTPVVEPVEPRPIAQPACTFGPAKGSLLHAVDFAVSGKRFATVGGTVELKQLAIARDASRAYAVLESETLRLASDVHPDSVRFALRPGIDPLHGWLELRAASIASMQDGQATVSFKLPTKFEPATPVPNAQVPCSALTVMSTDKPSAFGDVRLKSGVRTPVMATPGGTVVGHFQEPHRTPLRHDSPMRVLSLPDLKQLEEQGAYVKVRLVAPTAAVVGWIAKSALEKNQPMAGILGLLNSNQGGSGTTVACEHDTELVVDLGTTRVRVGELRAGKAVPGTSQPDGSLLLDLRRRDPFAAVFGGPSGGGPSGGWDSGDDRDVIIEASQASGCEVRD